MAGLELSGSWLVRSIATNGHDEVWHQGLEDVGLRC
jgi:hypothetical protein